MKPMCSKVVSVGTHSFTWLWLFIAFWSFLLNVATSLFTQDVGCKSKRVGAHATITFVVAVVFANCEMYLSPMLVSFFAVPLVPLQRITTSFFDSFSVCRLRQSVIPFVLALGFVIPITLYELPKRSASLPAHPRIWLSPRRMTLRCFLLCFS